MERKTHLIQFEKRLSHSIDEEGIEVQGWEVVKTAMAKIENRNGNRKWATWQSGGLSEEVTNLFTINYLWGFMPDTSMRLVYQGEVYDIEGVDNIRGMNKEVEIRAIKTGRVLGI